MLATSANPALQLSRAPSNPLPVPAYSDKWVKRTYSNFKTAAAGATGVDFLCSSFGIPGTKYYVDKLQVWKLGSSTGGFGDLGLTCTFKQGAFTDLGSDDVTALDFGTASSLPGVTCKVPLGHATGVSTSGTTVLASANAAVGNSNTETFVCHLTAWVSV